MTNHPQLDCLNYVCAILCWKMFGCRGDLVYGQWLVYDMQIAFLGELDADTSRDGLDLPDS